MQVKSCVKSCLADDDLSLPQDGFLNGKAHAIYSTNRVGLFCVMD